MPECRRQRPRRHADEREHLARRRHAARAGVSARGDGGADPFDRAHPAATRHAVSAGIPRSGAPYRSTRRNSPRWCRRRPARCWRRNNAPQRLPLPRQRGRVGVGAPRNTASARVTIRGFAPTSARRSSGWSISSPMPGSFTISRLDANRARRRQMRQETVVAKSQRHHQGGEHSTALEPRSSCAGTMVSDGAADAPR